MKKIIVCGIMPLLVSLNVVSQRTWQWASLQKLSPALYQKAMEKHQGIIGMDDLFPSIAYIGTGTVSVEAVNGRPTHYPIDGYKRPHTGMMTTMHKRPQSSFDSDDDVNMYILPNPGDTYFESFKATGRSKATEVEGEIDVMLAFWNNISQQFPKRYAQVTGYGPWIHEKHNYWDTRVHDYIEIHPMEHMWSAELAGDKLQYNIGLFSDNSVKMNKWRPNPIVTISAIAFEAARGEKPLTYVIEQKENFKTIPYPLYSDNSRLHILMDGRDTVAIVQEPANTPLDVYSIEFAAVSKSGPVVVMAKDAAAKSNINSLPLVRYKGFIKVHAAVKDGGHNTFRVVEKSRSINPTVRVEVQLVAIHCETAAAQNQIVNLYGSYGISAAVGGSPYYVNTYTPGAVSTVWEKTESTPLKLGKGRTEILNALRYYMVSPSGEIMVYGDVDEKHNNIQGQLVKDELSQPQYRRFKVSEMGIGTPNMVTDWYTGNGIKLNVIYIVKRMN